MHAELLAEKVSNRRVEIGLSTSAAARQAGISRATWRSLESGDEREHLSVSVARSVDRVLGWKPGSTAGAWRYGPDFVIELDDKRILVADLKRDSMRWDIGEAIEEVVRQLTMEVDNTSSGRGDYAGFSRSYTVMQRAEVLALFAELSNQQRSAVITILRGMQPCDGDYDD